MSREPESSEKAVIAKGRGHVYHLLSMLYVKEVSPELLATLTSNEMIDMFKSLCMDMVPILRNTPQKELLNDLAQEYTALFIAPGGIHPYESVRLKGLLCQEPTSQVKEFYKKCGLVVKEDCPIFPDHLGMELEFMGYLADKESSAWNSKDEKNALDWCNLQKEFFSKHMSTWVFKCLQDLDKYAFHPFYKEMARLTQKFLAVEKDHLEKLVERSISDEGNKGVDMG